MASSSPGTCDPSTSAGLICLVPRVMCQATPGGNPALANSTTGGSEVASEPATMEFHHSTNRSRDLRLGPKPPGPHFLLRPKSREPCGYGLLCHTLLFSCTLPPWPRSQPPLQEAGGSVGALAASGSVCAQPIRFPPQQGQPFLYLHCSTARDILFVSLSVKANSFSIHESMVC